MGYLVIALISLNSGAGSLGVEAVSFYLLAYVIMSLGAFGVMMVVSDSAQERDHIGHYQGLFWRNPWLGPCNDRHALFSGRHSADDWFYREILIFAAGVQAGHWGLLIAMVIGSGMVFFTICELCTAC